MINLNKTLSSKEKDHIIMSLTPLRIDQLVQYIEGKPLSQVDSVLSDMGILNGDYYLLENVHGELAHYYKHESEAV